MTGRADRLWRLLAVAVLGLGLSCNFDSAFDRYCANNPRCADAATGPEVAPEAGPEAGHEVGPEAGPELGPEAGPEAGPDLASDLGPDVWSELPWGAERDAGPPHPNFGLITPCGSDMDCGRNSACHPVGKVCMVFCRTPSDCPIGLDLCKDLPSPGGNPRKVCMCDGTTGCQAKLGANFRCNTVDNLCEPSCSPPEFDYCGSLFQPPRVCDSGNQVCQRCGSNADCPTAAQPHCDQTRGCMRCIDDLDCAGRAESQCNGATGACVAPSASP